MESQISDIKSEIQPLVKLNQGMNYYKTLYCIVLYLQPVVNPKSYDGARVLEASGRPMLIIGRSYCV